MIDMFERKYARAVGAPTAQALAQSVTFRPMYARVIAFLSLCGSLKPYRCNEYVKASVCNFESQVSFCFVLENWSDLIEEEAGHGICTRM
jgi:hypothetical protein